MRFLLLMGILLASGLVARDLPEVQKLKLLRAAANGTAKPFNYFDHGKLVGFEIDLAEEMAKRLGVKVEWMSAPFHALLIGLKADRYDLVASSHTITPEREKVVSFVASHYCTGAVIVSRRGGPRTQTDLKDKRLALALGTDYLQRLTALHLTTHLQAMPAETDALQSLLSEKSDSWITDEWIAREAVQAHPTAQLTLGEKLFAETNAMVVSQASPKLQEALSRALAEMLKDGTYARLSRRYFDRDLRCATQR